MLVKMLPLCFREPEKLHEILRRLTTQSGCIFVFIMSTVDSSWYLNPRRVLPPHIVSNLSMDTITFNGVAVTLLQKALKRVVSGLNLMLTPAQVKRIAESSDGSFYFYFFSSRRTLLSIFGSVFVVGVLHYCSKKAKGI